MYLSAGTLPGGPGLYLGPGLYSGPGLYLRFYGSFTFTLLGLDQSHKLGLILNQWTWLVPDSGSDGWDLDKSSSLFTRILASAERNGCIVAEGCELD